MKSYTSARIGPLARAEELLRLARHELRAVEPTVAAELREMRTVEAEVGERLGLALHGLRVLEIGSGPHSRQLAYLARDNDALGVDTNIVPRGARVGDWVALVRQNGTLRAVKTLARRALLVDRRYRQATVRALACGRWPVARVHQMDAGRLALPDASVDFVFSRAVFEHLDDPSTALQEIRRVLRDGGGLFVILHLYTSDSGCHDPRLLTAQRGELPYWSHLRPGLEHLVRPNAQLNELRLPAWRELFATQLPGAEVEARGDAGAEHERALAQLRQRGELAGFDDEELLSPTVWALWRKPAAGRPAPLPACAVAAARRSTPRQKSACTADVASP